MNPEAGWGFCWRTLLNSTPSGWGWSKLWIVRQCFCWTCRSMPWQCSSKTGSNSCCTERWYQSSWLLLVLSMWVNCGGAGVVWADKCIAFQKKVGGRIDCKARPSVDGTLGAVELLKCLYYMLAEGADICKIQARLQWGGTLEEAGCLVVIDYGVHFQKGRMGSLVQ